MRNFTSNLEHELSGGFFDPVYLGIPLSDGVKGQFSPSFCYGNQRGSSGKNPIAVAMIASTRMIFSSWVLAYHVSTR